MKSILELIDSRRSVRSFTDQKIEHDKLEKILHAAIYAPTGRNAQPLFFIILQNPKKKEELYSKVNVRPNYYNADSILFVFERNEDHLNELNCGAAIQNALLVAEDLGLGAVWVHSAREKLNSPEGKKVLMEVLGFDKEYTAIDAIALGYIKGDKPKAKERNLDGDRII